MSSSAHSGGDSVVNKSTTHNLGTIQLRHQETNEIILVPTPSNDPNDPLNWSPARKYFIFALVCSGIFFAHAIVVGPSVALELITLEFFDDVAGKISKTSFLQTGCSLMIGLGNIVWVPVAVKYGRRPVYVTAYTLMTACCIWSALASSFPSALAARLLLGLGCAAAEIIAPLTITDIFFLHQRGRAMVIYTCAMSAGVGIGVVFAGLITRSHSWRMIFWVFAAFIGTTTVLVFFALPETQYQRQPAIEGEAPKVSSESDKSDKVSIGCAEESQYSTAQPISRKKRTLDDLKLYTGTYTSEKIVDMAFRPLFAIVLPAVLWATLVSSVTTGMIVVISANFSTAFSTIYGFDTWQSGLTFISTVIGSLIAIFLGGHFTDLVADKLTVRNGGIRTPEMRLPAIAISLVTGPLACILYGIGFANQLHWIVPTIGIGLVNFTTVQANNVALLYILDSYRPIAGEVIVTQSVFKAIFGFLLSFYVNNWVQKSGYMVVFAILAGVSATVFLSTIVFWFAGDKLRQGTWKWGFVKRFLHWHPDREVGE